MKPLKLLFNTLNFLMLGMITVSVVYIALWFEHYEQYIL
jgi:hypothetical protein